MMGTNACNRTAALAGVRIAQLPATDSDTQVGVRGGSQRAWCASCALVAATSGPIDDGGNGATLLTLISHST
jgi:hypothetical protein